MTESNQQLTGESVDQVRVRFAPSPTGALHIGGARTAYFNWLFARQQGGTFVLRIDDTDKARSTEESYQQILDSFRWLGLDWDEGPQVGGDFGPYRQSERMHIYQARLDELIAADKVFPCFCSAEELQAHREAAQQAGRTPRYSGRCRHLSKEEREELIQSGHPFVYRLKSPGGNQITVTDLVRGDVNFAAEEVDDFIIWKADGTPTYHFASCVDDAAMRITHIIRAEEHLSNTPRHIAVFEALCEPIPVFAHVPMILAPDRSKLSKRHGATSVEEYRDAGILPEALVNYLLLLGFSPGDGNDIVSRDSAVEMFALQRVAKHAAVYDVKKLEWLNAHYIRSKPVDELLGTVWPMLENRGFVVRKVDRERAAWVRTVVEALMQRSRTLVELVESSAYYFQAVTTYDEKGAKKHFSKPGVVERLENAAASLDHVDPFIVSGLDEHYRRLIAEWGIKAGDLIHPTRLALTGLTAGPGLFDVMALLGREECQNRMRRAAKHIQSQVAE